MNKKSFKSNLQDVINRSQQLTDEEIERDFLEALQDARATAKKYNITQEDIEAEIRAVRSQKKHKRK